jgi:predicted transposase YbfD/YdcC
LASAERQSASSSNKGHGRIEERTLISSTGLNSYLDWPFLAQAFKLTRSRTRHGKTCTAVVYGITSLRRDQASADDLLKLVRSHWGIENSVFYVRDVCLGEDHCRVRTGTAPHILSTLRNTMLNLLRSAGSTNIAATLRRHAAAPLEALGLLKWKN